MFMSYLATEYRSVGAAPYQELMKVAQSFSLK